MNYVNSLNLFGIEAKEIPSITGSGVPTNSTEGAVGMFYMNTNNGAVYKCVAVNGNIYTWELMNSGNASSGDTDVFWVTVRGDDTNGYICENALDEIYEAYTDGKLLFCAAYIDGIRVNFSAYIAAYSKAVFVAFVENMVFNLSITPDRVQLSRTQIVTYDNMENLTEDIDEYIDNRIDEKLAESGSGGNVDLTGVVKSVNGNAPDNNGNISIDIPTDDHINNLISTALGVIENGSY